jgi:hypothetical protein
MARRTRREKPDNESLLSHFVEEILTAADPFYHGRRRGQALPQDEDIRPLDPAKTARDLGRETAPVQGEARVRPSLTTAGNTGAPPRR